MPGSVQESRPGSFSAMPPSMPNSGPGSLTGEFEGPSVTPSVTPSITPTGPNLSRTSSDIGFGIPRRASAAQLYARQESFSAASSVNSRQPMNSYVAPSQIERSRSYLHWPTQFSHNQYAYATPQNQGPLGGQSFAQPSLSINSHKFSPSPPPSSPSKPQRSLLSSMIAQSRGNSNRTSGAPSQAGSVKASPETPAQPAGQPGSFDPSSFSASSLGGPMHRSASMQSTVSSLHMPAEPVLVGRRTADLPWSQQTVASPPRTEPLRASEAFTPRIMEGLQRPQPLKAFHFANCDTRQVVKMMTVALNQIIQRNDKLYPSNSDGKPLDVVAARDEQGGAFQKLLLGFHGCNVPGIGLEDYLMRILRYCPTTANVFLSLLVYLDRLSAKGTQLSSDPQHSLFMLDSFNVHRLVIAGMAVAIKFYSDIFYKNSRYAQVGGLPVDELNYLELQFLLLLDFRLMISVEELQQYADFILNYADLEAKPTPAAGPGPPLTQPVAGHT